MSNISKRSWKLQEFTAHSANVNCLALGHKSGRVLVTGGDDKKVNLWAIGNQSCIMSLGGHLTPVECVKFGQTEDLVCAGSQTGVLKVWDLEATKLIRTLSGHKAAIKCIDFHPYGEYLASGSLDTVIKMWDIRCKGSIFSYKGHKQTVNSIKFSPDGQWIVSGDEEGMIKIWDLRIGRVLTDLNKHSGAITDVEFHPNEFLLGSSGADRSVYIWDLENFQPISKSEKEPSIIRCLHFAIDGECLFGGCAEQLKVYGWEPTCICDTVSIGWGKVQDMAISHNQLIGASFYLSTVLICVVDLTKVCLTAPPSQVPAKQPQSSFTRDTVVRKSFNKHQSPSSESSKMKMDVKPIEEYETEPEDESSFFIANRNDYNSIFSPQRTLTRSPLSSEFKTVVTSSSVQNTTSQNVSVVTRTKVQQQLNKTTTSVNHSVSSQVNLNSVLLHNGQCVSSSPPKLHQNPPLSVRQQSPPPVALRSATVTSFSSLNSDEHSDNFLSSETDENIQASTDFDIIPLSNNNLPNGISVDEFLPSDYKIAGRGNFNNDYTENDAISTITRGHEPMITVLKNRKKGLLVVYTIWRKKDLKCAMEQVVSMNDISLVVDILSVINGKSSLWSLDICAILLPSISELLQSKYEVYMSVGCDSLRLILRNFSSVIKTNTLWSVPTIGVDITKEERYKKCMKCYSVLVSIRAFLLKRQTMQGKLGQSFRELHTMLQEIDAT